MAEKPLEMTPEHPSESALFQAAVQLSGRARASFLDNACDGNAPLRQRMEELLLAHERTEDVMAEGAKESHK